MGKSTILRNQIKAIIDLVPDIDEDRVKLGYTVFLDSDEVLNNLVKEGPFVVIHDDLPTETTAGTFVLNAYQIPVSIYYGFDKNEDYDYTEINDLYELIRDALIAQESWDGVSNGPKDISVAKSNFKNDGTNISKTIEMTLTFESN